MNFEVKMGETFEAILKFKSDEAGVFRGIVDVKVDNFKNVLNQIEVSIACVSHSVYLID